MITISLCMIVKNEEAILGRCLDSIREAVDEIIIVDTGSTDNTRKVARKYTEKIYDFEWVDDFSSARNFAYSKATMDYQMWMDADDVLPESQLAKLLRLKNTITPDIDIVTMKYLTHFDEQGKPTLISTRERLTKREKGYKWIDPVHECIPLIGNIFYSDIEIEHRKPKDALVNSARNLNIYKKYEAGGKTFTPRQLYYYARELKDHGQWPQAAAFFEKFLETKEGWFEDNIASCFNLAICYSQMGEEEKVLPILLRSFMFDAPRAEICSEIGYYYKRAKNYLSAFKWFRLAANLGKPESIGFVLQDYWGYIPNIECCVCLCELGEFAEAKIYNERAAKFKNTAATEINRKYLESKPGLAV